MNDLTKQPTSAQRELAFRQRSGYGIEGWGTQAVTSKDVEKGDYYDDDPKHRDLLVDADDSWLGEE